MKSVNAKCPICGSINQNLLLRETGGYMECEKCKAVVRVKPVESEAASSVRSFSRRACCPGSTRC